jgi:hypothetical protein
LRFVNFVTFLSEFFFGVFELIDCHRLNLVLTWFPT